MISNLDDCLRFFVNAKEANSELVLQNPPGSIYYMGLLYLCHMLKEAEICFPRVSYHFICDCDDDANAAIEALGMGFKTIMYSGSPELAKKLQNIAFQCQATVISVWEGSFPL